MKYKKIKMNGYRLFIQKTNKFKTVCFEICIKTKLTKETYLKMNPLAKILCEGTKKYPTSRELEIKSAKIYDPMYYSESAVIGGYIQLNIGCSFINEKYTEKGMNEETIKFILDLLKNPKVTEESFDKENFEYVKKELINKLKSVKENPRKYVNNRILEMLDKNSIWGYTEEEILKDLEKLTEKELYTFYKELLETSTVDVFIIGNILDKQIKDIFSRNLKLDNPIKENLNHFLLIKKCRKKLKQITKTGPFEQTNLNIGYKTEEITHFERYYVRPIYLDILNRSLFNEVREKNSMCYYVNMSSINTKNVLILKAGIEPGTSKKVIKLIKTELEKIRKGNFDEKEVNNSKAIYFNSLLSLEDKQKRILNIIIAEEYVDADPLEERKGNIEKVTKEDIINFANKICEDSLYILEGGKSGKKETF